MQLTANEELELRYMQARGFKWIARDENKDVYAYEMIPYKSAVIPESSNNYYTNNDGDYIECPVGEYDFLKWEDEPMEIDKLLRENGDIPLVWPEPTAYENVPTKTAYRTEENNEF